MLALAWSAGIILSILQYVLFVRETKQISGIVWNELSQSLAAVRAWPMFEAQMAIQSFDIKNGETSLAKKIIGTIQIGRHYVDIMQTSS